MVRNGTSGQEANGRIMGIAMAAECAHSNTNGNKKVEQEVWNLSGMAGVFSRSQIGERRTGVGTFSGEMETYDIPLAMKGPSYSGIRSRCRARKQTDPQNQ
jgi:hypothetical protein